MFKIIIAKIVFFIVLFFGIGLTAANAAFHYVRPDALGNNSGNNWQDAYKELPATLVRGDTYYLATGEYAAYNFDDPAQNANFIIIKKATPADHGTNDGWLPQYGVGSANFQGLLQFSTPFYELNGQTGVKNDEASYGITVSQGDNCSLLGYNLIKINTPNHDIHLQYLNLKHCGEYSNIPGGSKIILYADGELYNFYLGNSYLHDTSVGMVRLQNGVHNSVIERNYFARRRSDIDGLLGEAIRWSESGEVNGVIRYNTFQDINGQAVIYLSSGEQSNFNIYGNIFMNTDDVYKLSLGAIANNNNDKTTNTAIYNNTFVDLRGYSDAVRLWNGESNSVYNNLWLGCENILFTGVDHNFNSFDKALNFNEQSSQNNIQSDIFLNYSSGDYRLAAPTSPGLALSATFERDPLGVIRGADEIWDRGAYEYTTEPLPNSPDITPPIVSELLPTGTLAAGTTDVLLSVMTNEETRCRYGFSPGISYEEMTFDFQTENGIYHEATVTNLVNGRTYNYYVRCQDLSGNNNQFDYTINFTVSTVNNTDPVGFLDVVNEQQIIGWAYDDDASTTPLNIELYIDNQLVDVFLADINRPDLAPFYGNSTYHGFNYQLPSLDVGEHQLRVFAVNTPLGNNPELSGSPTVIHITDQGGEEPRGYIDYVSSTTVRGWVFDPDAGSAPIDAVIYIDGVHMATVTANLYRQDLIAAIGSPNHGFSVVFPSLAPGNHEVLVFAVNFPQSDNFQINNSPQTITISESGNLPPIGYIDAIDINHISGWAFDPDFDYESIFVHIYVDGKMLARVQAGLARPDLLTMSKSAYHGFNYRLPTLTAGNHRINIYAINRPIGDNPELSNSPQTVLQEYSLPIARNIDIAAITDNSITITFTTDELSVARAEYSLGDNFDNSVTAGSSYQKYHTITISGLLADSTYNYRLITTNRAGQNAISQIFSFHTAINIADTTSLSPTNFTAYQNNAAIHLHWTNPVDPNFVNVRLMRQAVIKYNVVSYGKTEVIYEGTDESYIDTNIDPNTDYRYKLSVKDVNGHYSPDLILDIK